MSQLALSLRPTKLEEILGNSGVKKVIKSWVAADSFPNSQLFVGPVGCGKSSVAEIVSRLCQGAEGSEGADIRLIDAGSVGKVDDMRALVEDSNSRPFVGRYRVFILEECHRCTEQAQTAMLVPMENNPWTIWLLTSSEPSKLLPSIRSRCAAATFEMKPLSLQEMTELSERALVERNPEGDWQPQTDEAAEFLFKKGVRQPREILGALDQFFSGIPIEQCVHGAEHEPLYKDVAAAVFRGDWEKTKGLLAQIPTADYRGMLSMVSAYLASALLKESVGPRADALATCLVGIGSNQFADGVAYAATKGLLYKTAKAIRGVK